jgi:hypothetical protein
VRASQKFKTDGLSKLVDDLNNIEEDPLNPAELKALMH